MKHYYTKEEIAAEVLAVQSGKQMSARFAEIVEIIARSVFKQYSDYRTDDFEEFAQDCIVRVLKAVPKIKVGQRCCAANYLWTACRNVLLMRNRRKVLWAKYLDRACSKQRSTNDSAPTRHLTPYALESARLNQR